MSVKLLFEHHLEFLGLTGHCLGSFESTLVKGHIVGNYMLECICSLSDPFLYLFNKYENRSERLYMGIKYMA